MEAPKKIYVHEVSAQELGVKLPYHIEYIRADVFIEKAVEWLKENLTEYCDGEDIEFTTDTTYNLAILQNGRLINDFKKAMNDEDDND